MWIVSASLSRGGGLMLKWWSATADWQRFGVHGETATIANAR